MSSAESEDAPQAAAAAAGNNEGKASRSTDDLYIDNFLPIIAENPSTAASVRQADAVALSSDHDVDDDGNTISPIMMQQRLQEDAGGSSNGNDNNSDESSSEEDISQLERLFINSIDME